MKNILVTGGCGFIGTNFILYLLEETDFAGRIVNVDSLTYAANPANLEATAAHFPDRYAFVNADIRNREQLSAVFDEFDIDTVCHFAAESHVDRSIVGPDDFIQTNILGTFNLLELVRQRQDRINLFHHVSTDEVYGTLGPQGVFTEETPYRPNSPYSASKASSDHLVRAYHATYAIPITVSNCSNNYGPYQFPEKLIPLMIINGLERKPLPVYGDGRNVRDWLYVRDHCTAVWKIMTSAPRGETFNIGGNTELENITLVETICDILDELMPDPSMPSRRELITFVKDRPGHDRRYAVDATKIANELQWRPAESFETGLHKTIAWYLENQLWMDRVRSGEYQVWIKKHYG